MGDASEVVREVGVNDFRVATEQQLFHLDHRLLGIAPGTVRVLFGWKVGFEDRFQHQHRCCHADPIPQGRDAQRPEFAVGLGYEHSSDWSRSVSLLPESKRQFAKPPLYPIRVDVREVLTIHPRRALVRAALGIGMRQNILAADLCRTGRRSDTRLLPSLSRATPSAASEHSSELIGCPISRSLTTYCVRLELRSLPTRLKRYYEGRPAFPSRASGWSSLSTPRGFPCCARFPCVHAAATTPAQRLGLLLLVHPAVSAFPERVVGSACASSFSRLARRSLALRPAHSRCHQFVTRSPEASATSLPP